VQLGASGGISRVTIQDVAGRAGVGAGTVSRVLNANANVSERTRRRVEAANDELGYKPDVAARALRRGRTGTIGAVVPFFTKHFYVEVLRAVARATAATDLSLIVFDIERREERERALGQVTAHGFLDGLLTVSLVPNDAELRAIAASGLQLVLIDGSHPALSGVEVDHAHGAYLAVRHLVQLGHRRIALIGRPDDPFERGFGPRLEGYRRALADANLDVDSSLLIAGEYSRESGRQAMEGLLTLAERPTAVFAASDLQAIGAMEAIREAGLRVPEDLAVVGYNDIELAEYLGLTTVRLPTATMGEIGVRLLCESLAGDQVTPRRVRLRGELVVRRTSGGPLVVDLPPGDLP